MFPATLLEVDPVYVGMQQEVPPDWALLKSRTGDEDSDYASHN